MAQTCPLISTHNSIDLLPPLSHNSHLILCRNLQINTFSILFPSFFFTRYKKNSENFAFILQTHDRKRQFLISYPVEMHVHSKIPPETRVGKGGKERERKGKGEERRCIKSEAKQPPRPPCFTH